MCIAGCRVWKSALSVFLVARQQFRNGARTHRTRRFVQSITTAIVNSNLVATAYVVCRILRARQRAPEQPPRDNGNLYYRGMREKSCAAIMRIAD